MKSNKTRIVYCSGPLFCPEEIGSMTAIANVLEDAGFQTFLPHRDGLETYILKLVNSPVNINVFKSRDMIERAVFALDVFQVVERCDYFIFNMNGRVPDEGGVVEAAIAFAAGKPVVIYKNDYRTVFNGCDNSMVTGLTFLPKINHINKIPGALEKAANKLNKQGPSPYTGECIPPAMRKTIKLGKRIWQMMEKLNLKKPTSTDQELIDAITDTCLNDKNVRYYEEI
ncbi:MAG: nucleoside 2-deoxyribosyltransferase [Desulfobacteraceae bacterium]|nr:nucleoside 2-deoxyribosyltransferase [Desulfobacteraceae bacterium]